MKKMKNILIKAQNAIDDGRGTVRISFRSRMFMLNQFK